MHGSLLWGQPPGNLRCIQEVWLLQQVCDVEGCLTPGALGVSVVVCSAVLLTSPPECAHEARRPVSPQIRWTWPSLQPKHPR
jgi:hypothetical protein